MNDDAGPDFTPHFLVGGGEMGARMRAFQWSGSPLGSPGTWPRSLRTAAGIMLNARQPMFVAWGPELAFLYNDAYAPIFGAKHPSALGRPFRQVWTDIWDQISPLVETTLGGEPSWFEDLLIPMERHGVPEEAWFTFSYTPIRDEAGRVAGMFCAATETTGKVLSERRLSEERDRQRRQFEQAPGFITILSGPDHVFEFVNASYARLFGGRDFIGKTVREVFPDLEGQGFYELLDQVFATGERFVAEQMPIRLQATAVTPAQDLFLDFIYEPITDGATEKVTGIFVEGYDVTRRAGAEAALREQEQELRLLTDALPVLISYVDSEGCYQFNNKAYEDWFGRSRQSLRGKHVSEVIGETAYALLKPQVEAALSGKRFSAERQVPYRDGGMRHVRIDYVPRADTAGRIEGYYALVQDIGEQKRVESELQASERRLNAVLESVSDGFYALDDDWRFTLVNRACERFMGVGREEVLGRSVWEAFPRSVGTEFEARFRAVVADQAPTVFEAASLSRPERTLEMRAAPNEGGGIAVAFSDITERKRADEEMRRFNERLEAEVEDRTRERDRIHQLSNDLFAVATFDGRLETINPAWERLLGYSHEQLLARPFIEIIHPDDHASAVEVVTAMSTGQVLQRFEDRLICADGSVVSIAWTAVPEGDRFYAVGRDVTRDKEREEALRQSQKMEAVGQLTGGIAHDFNNLLQGITGSLDIVQRRIEQGRTADVARFVAGAMTSANRAAALTHRLLAFSRRQPIDPKPVKANLLVSSMEDLLRRSLGSSVELELVLAGGLWLTRCDVNQLESAILNLAINARDAMPEGGRLTIETCNAHLDNAYAARSREVSPGQYVCICVTDTGTGMSPDVVARAFDPFFTTKPIGQGTGLGLSMIYGFARQSEGYAKIYSEPGQGTTIKLYLPRFRGKAGVEESLPRLTDAHSAEEGEVVVVVEDDHVVRGLIVEVLGELGYRAIEAADGPGGIEALDAAGRVDLLITDIGLPGLNGRQVAEAARRRRPELKVLFMTGYAENAAMAGGFLEPGMEMVTKPVAMEVLATRIREMLKAE